ncbi:MAG: SelB C-terminal domain-containing protein [Thermomicrobiales bacterium]
MLTNQESISLAEYRDALGTTRRFAQALLEYFDRQRVTRRIGDRRVARPTDRTPRGIDCQMNTVVSLSELTAPHTHLFISPHYDDIALSCGGTAALVAEAGKDAVVALLFGDHPDPDQPMTPFADHMHAEWGMSADEVIAGRRAEEASRPEFLGCVMSSCRFATRSTAATTI